MRSYRFVTGFLGMMLPATPFAAIPMLLVSPAESDLRRFLDEAHELALHSPSVLALIDADLDAHGLRKKALRTADQRWREARSGTLPGHEVEPAVTVPQKLAQGVPPYARVRRSRRAAAARILRRGLQGV